MMSRHGLCLALLATCLVTAAGPAVAGRVQYDCPDLHNEKKRSIEPLTQGYDGWFFRNADLKMDFSISPEAAQYFGRLSEALERRGIKLVLVPLLSRALMAPGAINHDDSWQENYDPELAKLSYANMVADLKSRKVGTVNLLPLVETYGKDPYAYNFKRDIHWKPEGAQLVAQIAAEELKKLPEYGTLPKVSTISAKREPVGRSGTITEELRKLCKGDIEAEPYIPYQAERVAEQNADALFGGETASIPVALLGTSFSGLDDFNFLPFLEENSKLEIANFAISGGGMFTSLISYLSSPFFHENIPPVMIWETQSIYDFNAGVEYGFRQAIPAVEGPCPDDRTIARNTVEITEREQNYTLLENLEKFGVKGSDYYLYIYADNLGFKQFTLEMEYDDQDGEWFPVDRSDRYNNKGYYYIELSERILGNLSKVLMKDVPNTRTKLEVRLCRKTEKPEPAGTQATVGQPPKEKELP